MGPMSERFEMRVDEDILEKVDKWRAKQNGMPSRAEAMRRLVELGLVREVSGAVRFSDGEKLLAVMMRDIYEHLKIKGDVNPNFISDVIYGGHYWALKWEMGEVFTDYEDDPRDFHFVVKVLEMWRLIEYAYTKLSKKDKDKIEKEAAPFGNNVKFRGFDGNNETSHLGIAQFVIHKIGKWSMFKGRELNSHSPMCTGYQRMLTVFEPMRAKLVGTELSADDLIRILKLNH